MTSREYMINAIMSLMTRLEQKHNEIFSKINPQLESKIFSVIDSKRIDDLHIIITELENELENELEK